MGAIEPFRWHSWQRCCKMGATSLVNVTGLAVAAASALLDISAAVAANEQNPAIRTTTGDLRFVMRAPPSEPGRTGSRLVQSLTPPGHRVKGQAVLRQHGRDVALGNLSDRNAR